MSFKVECFPRGPLSENTYIVTDEATGDKAVIDPGCFDSEIAEFIGERTSLKYLLLTHGHYDHYTAAQQYIDAYPDVIFAGPEGDTKLMYKGRDNAMLSSLDRGEAVCPEAKQLLKDGDVIKIGESELRVIETPGHTKGSICFVTDELMFSGDLIFRLSVGNTSFESGSWEELVRSIEDRIYTLDERIVIYPGHGAATTVGYEKKANPFV